MRLTVTYLELHNPLFLNGNLGSKIDAKAKSNVILEFDFEMDKAIVQWNGKTALVPSSNIASMTLRPEDAEEHFGITPSPEPTFKKHPSHPAIASIASAQIENPSMPKEGARFKAEFKPLK